MIFSSKPIYVIGYPPKNFKQLVRWLLFVWLITSGFPSDSQTKKGDLGAIRLENSKFKIGVSDGDSLILIAFSYQNKRFFRSYTTNGKQLWTSMLKSKRAITDNLIGVLQNENEFLLYFEANSKENEIEVISINKRVKAIEQRELDLVNGKVKVLSAIKDKNQLIILVESKKTKEVGAIVVDNSGQPKYTTLSTNSSETSFILKGDYQFIEPNNQLKPGALIDARKVYRISQSQYLLVVDPTNTTDRGNVNVFKLDLTENSLNHRTLRNEYTLNSRAVRTYYHNETLYRLVIESNLFSLNIYDLQGQLLQQFKFTPNDDFNFPNSNISHSGGMNIFGSDRIAGPLDKTRKVLRFLAKGNPFLKVESRKDSLLELTIGSFKELEKDEYEVVPSHGVYDSDGSLMNPLPMEKKELERKDMSETTVFKSVLTPEFGQTAKNLFVETPRDLMQNFIERQEEEMILTLTFPHNEYFQWVVLENVKKGISMLYSMRMEYFKSF